MNEITLGRLQAMLDASPFIHLLKMRAVSLDREKQQVTIASGSALFTFALP